MPIDRLIVAVVVTYRPEPDTLIRLLGALASQVSFTVVVDNGPAPGIERWLFHRLPAGSHQHVFPVSLNENRGIAAAQNIGIAWARKRGADYVMLSDQDSIPGEAMVEELLAVAEQLRRQGERLACVGPRYLDPRHDNPPPFLRVQGLRLKRLRCDGKRFVPVDYLVASGCLIPVDVLDAVGGMREDLFIDYVDIEWGLRARHFGYQSFGVCTAAMIHCLGETPVRLLWRRVPVHSPLRHYYHFRNAVFLYKQPWVPLNWKLVDGWRLIMRYGFYALVTKPRLSHWRMMTRGLWHGLRNKSGKHPASS